MVQLYLFCGSVVTIGWLWFFVVRPIVVDAAAAYAGWRESHAPLHHDPHATERRRTLPSHRWYRVKRHAPAARVMSRTNAPNAVPNARTSTAPVRVDFPLLNGQEPRSEPFLEPADLALNGDEIAAVARMILHNRSAAKPSKSSTIAAGFGVSRGGSYAYIRASAIYDALFGPPPPAIVYHELSPEQERTRQQLQLRTKSGHN